MTTFWILAGALLALVMTMLLRPLLGIGPGKRMARERASSLKRALAEAAESHRAGDLDETGYQQQRQTLMETYASELEQDGAPAPASQRRNTAAAVLVLVAVPLGTIWLYQSLGAGSIAFGPLSGTSNPAIASSGDAANPESVASVDELMAGLEARLAENPEDQQGWELLGRSHLELGQFVEAANAYQRLYELTGDEPSVMVMYAEALARSRDGALQGEPTTLVNKALALEPNNQRGLWLGGLIAIQDGDGPQTLRQWRHLLTLLPPDSSVAQGLSDQIREVEARFGLADAVPPAAAAQQAPAASGDAPSVTVVVELAPDLNDRVGENDTLFVYARAVNGPRMPLAMARHVAGELPLQVRLDDTMSMMPNMTLSRFPTVEIVARVSKSGTATPQSGDLIGTSPPLEVSPQSQIAVQISQVVP